jgi:hypothetical protein
LAPGASGATLVSQVTPPPKFPVLSVEFLGRVFFLGRVETLGAGAGEVVAPLRASGECSVSTNCQVLPLPQQP